ncbi:MAG: reverse transcriptase family protein, partial [Candidatus Thiodiazotropha taylori]|nr:reverse transcriptase family protein [Candidatus Thiodiazotropha taylori]
IIKSINQLKTNKSGGPDKIINEFLIHGRNVLVPTLCNLFNKIYEYGYFPEAWSEGYIIPLHKKGSINEVENYRGITLLSTLGKLFTRVINNRLTEWAENYAILIEAQAGFRQGMGTVDNLFVLHGLVSHMLNQGAKLYCAFIDFTKAFDYIVRENLWYKLIKLGLRGKILNIIKSMYTSVKSRVKFCNKLGNEFFCQLGVRQGECLSPMLFSLFLNDIEEQFIMSGIEGLDVNLFKVFMLLYADDIVIFSNTAEELQSSLDLLSEYCKRWKLKVNVSKTKVMVFRKGGILPRNLMFYYDGVALEITKQFKYLGVVFTSGGSFAEAQNTLAGQAQKAIFKLNKYLQKFTFISPKHKLDLFDKLISPILNYACEMWGFIQANSIERVHLQFCKKLLGVKKTTQNDFIYGELGRTSYQVRRYLFIVKYWFKLLSSQSNKYIKLVYNLMLRDIELLPTKVNWASLVRHLFCSLGFYEVWVQQGVGDYSKFISALKQRLNDNFIQNWRARLNESPRATFYKSIAAFHFQPYLENINVYKFIQALSKLRVSSHRLEIEAGRWRKPVRVPLNERKCINCQVIEDEYHFIIECHLYNDLRKKYISKYFWSRPSMFKFVELINSTNQNCVRKLGAFIYQAFKLRTELLY